MPVFQNRGGVHASPKAIFRNVGGSSHAPVKGVWRNVGGTWVQLWSALSIEVYVISHRSVRTGGGSLGSRYYDQITFGVRINGSGTPSSYLWGGDTFGTGSTVVFNGPVYDANQYTYQLSATASVSVVIDGQTYSDSLPFTYTADHLA